MKTLMILSLMILVSCGKDDELLNTADQGANLKSDKNAEKSDSGDDCKTTKTDEGVWLECGENEAILIANGKDGKDGVDGEDGLAGEKGEKGDKGDTGDQGLAGANGVDGLDGLDGTNGTNGQDGEDAFALDLVDADDNLIGQVAWVSDVTGDFWVIDGTKRFEIDRADGTFYQYYWYYFTGTNCDGEMRMVLKNGQFGNVNKNYIDGKFYEAYGEDLGTFNFNSKIVGNSCTTNNSGSILNSFATREITLDFPYPVDTPQIRQ